MAVSEIAFDTNAYTAFKQGKSEAIEIVQRAPRLALSSVVLGELRAGFAVGSRDAQNRVELQQFIGVGRVRILLVDDVTSGFYAMIYRTLRAKGKPIPTNDMWIAATVLQHGCALFSYDAHFQHIDGIVVGTSPIDLLLP